MEVGAPPPPPPPPASPPPSACRLAKAQGCVTYAMVRGAADMLAQHTPLPGDMQGGAHLRSTSSAPPARAAAACPATPGRRIPGLWGCTGSSFHLGRQGGRVETASVSKHGHAGWGEGLHCRLAASADTSGTPRSFLLVPEHTCYQPVVDEPGAVLVPHAVDLCQAAAVWQQHELLGGARRGARQLQQRGLAWRCCGVFNLSVVATSRWRRCKACVQRRERTRTPYQARCAAARSNSASAAPQVRAHGSSACSRRHDQAPINHPHLPIRTLYIAGCAIPPDQIGQPGALEVMLHFNMMIIFLEMHCAARIHTSACLRMCRILSVE